jgi:hypothetical protein
VVVDATGAVLPGVTITITSPALAGNKVVVTESNGSFVAPALPVGVYKLEAVLDGFISVTVENISVRPGTVMKPNIKMSPGLKSEVTVVASPVLDVLSSAASNNISAETINELPKGRSWESIVQLAPAVNQETIQGSTGISFRGATISENAYIVDGVDTTSTAVGNQGQQVVLEFVNEVQVKSGFIGADYGGALGGIVNVITKSGANGFRALVNFQYSGSALTADPRPTLRVVPTNSKAYEYITYAEDPQKQLDFGGTAGGSIRRDRLWFFVGFMPQYINTDRDATFSDKTTGSATNEVRRDYFTGKLTAKAGQNLNLNFNSSISPDSSQGLLPSQDGTSQSTVDYAARGSRTNKYNYSLGMDWVANSNIFVNAFVGYFTKTFHDVGVPIGDRYRYQTSNIGMAGVPESFQHPILWETLPPTETTYNNDDTRTTFGATASFAFNAGGRHMLKTGFQYARPTQYLNYGYSGYRVDLAWNTSTAGQRGTYGYWRAFDLWTKGEVVSNNQAIFMQDTWSAGRFTLNLGLRTEREKLNALTATGAPAQDVEFGFGDKLAPRLGVAWDVKGDSSWKVYANAGLFYDMMKQGAARDGFGGGAFKISYYTLDTYDWTRLNMDSTQGSRLIFALNLRTVAKLDPDIKAARTNVYDVGTEFELGNNMTFGMGYVHRAVANANEDIYMRNPGGPPYTYQKYMGNPGEGLITQPFGAGYPAQPKFERTYDGVDFQLRRRLANNWTGGISYTFSRLTGNYDGLADSDQQIYSDVNPNQGIYCDYLQGCYDAYGRIDSGRLPGDRPHQFKMNGSYMFPWGLTVGAYFSAISGTPITASLGVSDVGGTAAQLVTHPEGRGGNGRNPMLTQMDLMLNYGFKLGKSQRLTFLFNVINLFDQDQATRTYQSMLLGGSLSVPVPLSTYFNGYNYQAAIDAAGTARDPRFLQYDRYQIPRAARIGVKLDF